MEEEIIFLPSVNRLLHEAKVVLTLQTLPKDNKIKASVSYQPYLCLFRGMRCSSQDYECLSAFLRSWQPLERSGRKKPTKGKRKRDREKICFFLLMSRSYRRRLTLPLMISSSFSSLSRICNRKSKK